MVEYDMILYQITKAATYLTRAGKQCSVFCEQSGENQRPYNGAWPLSGILMSLNHIRPPQWINE